MSTLFQPLNAGKLRLANRIVMAPLTRNRSPNAVPPPLTATYYAQRASAGLIITEATAISHQGQGYADVPGLYAPEQLAGWRRVTDAVHAAGGTIVVPPAGRAGRHLLGRHHGRRSLAAGRHVDRHHHDAVAAQQLPQILRLLALGVVGGGEVNPLFDLLHGSSAGRATLMDPGVSGRQYARKNETKESY